MDFTAYRPNAFRVALTVAAVSWLLGNIYIIISRGELPSLAPLIFVSAFYWLSFGSIWAVVYLLFGRKPYVIRVLPDSLEMRTGRWVLLSAPWDDVESVGQATVGDMSALWRVWAYSIGHKRSRILARVRVRGMLRQSPFLFPTTTRGIGWPGFSRTTYLAPDDVEGFVEAARSRLKAVAT